MHLGDTNNFVHRCDLLLSLLEAHALLYQHQRQKMDGVVVATEADFEVVAALITERQSAINTGLGRHAQQLLSAVWSAGLTTFSMENLITIFPDWTRYAFRSALDELVACDYLSSPRSGRGSARMYHLHGTPKPGTNPKNRIMIQQVGELAKVGETENANLNLVRATG